MPEEDAAARASRRTVDAGRQALPGCGEGARSGLGYEVAEGKVFAEPRGPA
jgi:hypothetical protein